MIVGTSIGALNAGALAQFAPEVQCDQAGEKGEGEKSYLVFCVVVLGFGFGLLLFVLCFICVWLAFFLFGFGLFYFVCVLLFLTIG